MACAQTGSGKTAAFLFPLLSKTLLNGREDLTFNQLRSKMAYPISLIIVPTRELAIQIYDEARKFAYRSPVRPVVVYGGAEIRTQINELEKGVDLLVATPGRLVDLLKKNKVDLSHVKYLVLDEADRMLDMGFEHQIRQIVEKEGMTSIEEGRVTLLFSATFPVEIQRLAQDFLNNYIFLRVGRIGSTTESIKQVFINVPNIDKKDTLLDLLEKEKGSTLVFVETKKDANELQEFLCKRKYSATSIHGDRSQREREYALYNFSTGKIPIIVATDVASRGLDISNVKHVINYDLPHNIDDYVHRIGRTGRAGRNGLATAFVNENDKNILPDLFDLLKEAKQEIPDFFFTFLDQMPRRNPKKYSKFGGKDFRKGNSNFYNKGNRNQFNSHNKGFESHDRGYYKSYRNDNYGGSYYN